MKHAGRDIDLKLMLKRLGEGYNDGVVADEVHCSRQYIGLRRKEWEKAGKLKPIPVDERKGGKARKTTRVAPVIKAQGDGAYEFDEIQQALLKTFAQAKNAEAIITGKDKEIRELKAKLKSRYEYELRVQQGDMPAPLTRGKKKNLTYHINLYEPESPFNLPVLDNIILFNDGRVPDFMLCEEFI